MFQNIKTHNLIRKYVISLGTLFNDIHVTRLDKSGNIVNQIHVPISFSNKRSWYIKRTQDNLENIPISALSFPRMYYDLIGFEKDSTRQLPNTANIRLRNTNERRAYMMKNRVPYKFFF